MTDREMLEMLLDKVTKIEKILEDQLDKNAKQEEKNKKIQLRTKQRIKQQMEKLPPQFRSFIGDLDDLEELEE